MMASRKKLASRESALCGPYGVEMTHGNKSFPGPKADSQAVKAAAERTKGKRQVTRGRWRNTSRRRKQKHFLDAGVSSNGTHVQPTG